jgi:hypothetical protein
VEGFERIGMSAALDLGDAVHARRFGLALDQVRGIGGGGGESIGAWLVARRADWSFAGVPPSLARAFADEVAALDSRLVAVGLGDVGHGRREAERVARYRNATDALVIDLRQGGKQGSGGTPGEWSWEALHAALATAAEATAGAHPFLALVESTGSVERLRSALYTALVYGASGVVLSAEGIEDPPWDAIAEHRDGLLAAARSLAAAEIAARADRASVRVRAYVDGETAWAFAANATSAPVSGVSVEADRFRAQLSLGPWEIQRLRIDAKPE